MNCGGASEEKPASEEIQEVIESFTVKSEAEKKYGKPFAEYKAVSYRSQVVAGTNFFVKVNVGSDDFVHLRIFRPLPHVNSPITLSDIQLNKTAVDPVEYF